jgi:hypothetical protein
MVLGFLQTALKKPQVLLMFSYFYIIFFGVTPPKVGVGLYAASPRTSFVGLWAFHCNP